MICQVLGCDLGKSIDDDILGFMTTLFLPIDMMFSKFDYCQFLYEDCNTPRTKNLNFI